MMIIQYFNSDSFKAVMNSHLIVRPRIIYWKLLAAYCIWDLTNRMLRGVPKYDIISYFIAFRRQ